MEKEFDRPVKKPLLEQLSAMPQYTIDAITIAGCIVAAIAGLAVTISTAVVAYQVSCCYHVQCETRTIEALVEAHKGADDGLTGEEIADIVHRVCR